MEDGYLPMVKTLFRTSSSLKVEASALATVFSNNQKSVVVADYRVSYTGTTTPTNHCLYLALMPAGPSGFQRHDRAGRYISDRRIGQLRLDPSRKFISVNASSGPVFKHHTDFFGLYGNGGSHDPEHYVEHNPFQDLSNKGVLNQFDQANDHIAGLCCGVFGWNLDFSGGTRTFELEVKLPVDDYRGAGELAELNQADGSVLAQSNKSFWKHKLNETGSQIELSD